MFNYSTKVSDLVKKRAFLFNIFTCQELYTIIGTVAGFCAIPMIESKI